MKRFFTSTAFLLAGVLLCAQNTNFEHGESLFLQNKPEESLAYLEAAVAAPDAPLRAYLYLGMAYQQLNRPDDAVAVYTAIPPGAGDSAALIAYSLGNVYYGKGDFPSAEACYTQAIQEDASYAPAYLNRANARLQTGNSLDAAADYAYYLMLDSGSPQRERIEAVLAAIQKAEDEAAAEQQRKAAEEAAARDRAQEQERQARESIPGIRDALHTIEGIIAAMKAEEAAHADSGGDAAPESEPDAAPADMREEPPQTHDTEPDISAHAANPEHRENPSEEE
ncbi:MAG: tetratricopeptide repeat protein [Treponema sp.]|jgi:hypothetical protein|nr:tetratricopeptide repeat protein [Treponema sp.]